MMMDDLTKRLRVLNDRVEVPDRGTFSLDTLKSRMQPETQNLSYSTIRNVAAVAVVIILANISVLIWSGNRDAKVAKMSPANTYLQTYNLSIY